MAEYVPVLLFLLVGLSFPIITLLFARLVRPSRPDDVKSSVYECGIEPDTPLQVVVSGNSLIVTPVNVGVGPEAVSESIKKLRPRYGQMLKNLAD